LILAIFCGKLDEIRRLVATKPSAPQKVLDAQPASESAISEPVQTQTI
jgi:hypothetical protein